MRVLRATVMVTAALLITRIAAITTMNVSEYHYASDSSGLACLDASRHHVVQPDEPNIQASLQWQDGELDLWLGAQSWLTSVAGHDARHLDIGCGFGRITLKFGWLFGLTTCLEADAMHMSHAKKNILSMSKFNRQNVEYVHNRFLEADVTGSNRYNAITCMQVVQHISTDEVPLWLTAAHRALAPGGIFVLATTHSNTPQLTIEGKTVSQERFNRRAVGMDVPKWGTSKLAVRKYGYQELEFLAKLADFTILDHGKFAYDTQGRPTHQWLALTKGSKETTLPVAKPTRVRDLFYSKIELVAMNRLKEVRSSGACNTNGRLKKASKQMSPGTRSRRSLF